MSDNYSKGYENGFTDCRKESHQLVKLVENVISQCGYASRIEIEKELKRWKKKMDDHSQMEFPFASQGK